MRVATSAAAKNRPDAYEQICFLFCLQAVFDDCMKRYDYEDMYFMSGGITQVYVAGSLL